MFKLFSENNTDLNWESINSDLADSCESNVKYKEVSVDQLSTVSQMLGGNICIDLNELEFNVSIEKLHMIVKLIPVFFIQNKNISPFTNLHESVYTPRVFEAIFLKKIISRFRMKLIKIALSITSVKSQTMISIL